MRQLGIMFPFYGAKFQWAGRYPQPEFATVVEPFAGAAGYSLRNYERKILLTDLDPVIAGVWDYLIRATERDILRLPLLAPGDDVRDLAVCQEARWLIGFWVNPGSATPKNIQSSFAKLTNRKTRVWGPVIRERIAGQCDLIRHWQVTCESYRDIGNAEATWFIDPPYQKAGKHYRMNQVDYAHLSSWARERSGQKIVCEAAGADWLPFTPLFSTSTASGNGRRSFSEAIWTGNVQAPERAAEQMTLWEAA